MAKMSAIAEGLTILSKYDPDGSMCAEHDEIYAGHNSNVSKEDKARLKKLGFTWDDSLECWQAFT